jgi:hypothetical protein
MRIKAENPTTSISITTPSLSTALVQSDCVRTAIPVKSSELEFSCSVEPASGAVVPFTGNRCDHHETVAGNLLEMVRIAYAHGELGQL